MFWFLYQKSVYVCANGVPIYFINHFYLFKFYMCTQSISIIWAYILIDICCFPPSVLWTPFNGCVFSLLVHCWWGQVIGVPLRTRISREIAAGAVECHAFVVPEQQSLQPLLQILWFLLSRLCILFPWRAVRLKVLLQLFLFFWVSEWPGKVVQVWWWIFILWEFTGFWSTISFHDLLPDANFLSFAWL